MVAPVDAQVNVPLTAPDCDEAILTYTGVAAMVPLPEIETDDENVVLSLDTSKPVGAVTKMEDAIFVPDTLNV